MTNQYIQGHVTLKYKGENLKSFNAKRKDTWYNILPYEGMVTEAVILADFDYLYAETTDTYNPKFLGDIRVSFKNGDVKNIDLIQVHIDNIVLKDVIEKEGKTYGTIVGRIKARISDTVSEYTEPVNTTKAAVPSGCLSTILKGALLICLLWLLWCFFFGKCGRLFKPCATCPQPIMVHDTTVVVKENEKIVVKADTIKTDRDGLGTGKLQVSLFWQNTEDLDLVIKTPSGFIYFANTAAAQGRMDVDENADRPHNSNAVENVFWNDKIPPGKYEVYLNYYKSYLTGPTNVPAKIRIRFNNREKAFDETVNKPIYSTWSTESCNCQFNPYDISTQKNAKKVFEFEIPENGKIESIF